MDATRSPDPRAAPPPADLERERYRRLQRRRGRIAWSVAVLLAVAVGLAVALGGNGGGGPGAGTVSLAGLMPAEMSADAYASIHHGQSEAEVLQLIGVPGELEAEIEEPELLQLFPSSPAGSRCEYWRIAEAPNHLVRLCFGGSPASLEQKSVAAKGEDTAPQTLA